MAQLDERLQFLLAGTFLGGSDSDQAHAIAMNNTGDIYVVGETYSPDFPTSTVTYDPGCGSDFNCDELADAFVTRFDQHLSAGQPADTPPPTNLIALEGYPDAIPVAWNKPAQAGSGTFLGYNVYRGTSFDGPYSKIAGILTRQYYRDETVTRGQTYFYVATAVYSDGESAYSNWDDAAAAKHGYTIYSQWASTAPTIDGIMASGEWQDAAPINITRQGSPAPVTIYVLNNNDKLFIAVDDRNDQSFDDRDQLAFFFDENLDREWPSSGPSGEGNFWVAWDAASASAFSMFGARYGYWPENMTWSNPTAPTGVRQGMSLSASMQYEVSIDLNGSPLDALPGDNIGALFFTLEKTPLKFNSFWPQEAERLKVITPDEQSWGTAPFSYGNLELAMPAEIGSPPTTLVALQGYHNAVPLAWAAPREAQLNTFRGYNVFRSTTSGGPYTQVASNLSRQYYRDETAVNGQYYYYVATAVYQAGESDYSNEDGARPQTNGYTIDSGWANSAPTIDGIINPGEWSQAGTVTITHPNQFGLVRLYMMNNNDYLFVAVDNKRDQILHAGDYIDIFFDKNLNREWPPSSPSDEGLLFLNSGDGSNPFSVFERIHGWWPDDLERESTTTSGVNLAISGSAGNIQYEASFNLSTSPLDASPGDIIGILIDVVNRSSPVSVDGSWPQENYRISTVESYNTCTPFSYGDLRLATSSDLEPAPDFIWAKSAGSSGGRDIATDGLGNYIVTGGFAGTADFGTTSLTSDNPWRSDIFVAKYDPSGNVLWAKKAGGQWGDNGIDVTTDKSGNIITTGTFRGTAKFGSKTLTSDDTQADEIFIAKYDASGDVLWARQAIGRYNDFGYGIATDGAGNIVVTGEFSGSVTFGTITLTATSPSMFIAKYDPDGTLLWAKQASGSSSKGNSIATDRLDNIIVTGSFYDTANFGTATLTSYGGRDIFLAKFGASGEVLWARQAGGTSNDLGRGVAIAEADNTVITGSFIGTATFG